MKNKIVLLMLIAFLLVLLCSCHCNVYNYDWHIMSIYHEVSFANGQVLPVNTDSLVHIMNPIGVNQSETYIVFEADGTVVFKPYGADEMYGTYELRHNGFFHDTSFSVTFENGEKIENGYAVSYYGNDELGFEFNGIKYYFCTSFWSDSATFEENQMRTEWLIDEVRSLADVNLKSGVVTVNENGACLSSASLDSNMDLLKDDCWVLAVHITADNELYVLDSLREGECVFVECIGYGTDKDGIIIYYVDPLPSELPPKEPERYAIYELIPELEYYMDHPDNIVLKLSSCKMPINPDEFNKYLTETDTDDVSFWFKDFFEITLTEYDEPPYNTNYPYTRYGVRLSDKLGENPSVEIYYDCGAINLNGKWYYIDDGNFPTWAGYSNYGFSCDDYNAKVLETDEYYSLGGIEFRPDKDQNKEYTEDQQKFTLAGEFGELTVYDATHFYYKGQHYTVANESDRDFSALFTNK